MNDQRMRNQLRVVTGKENEYVAKHLPHHCLGQGILRVYLRNYHGAERVPSHRRHEPVC